MKRAKFITPNRRQRGFTLNELLVTLTIVGVLATLVAPSMRSYMLNGRITTASNDLFRAYQVARTEAIKRQQNVMLCATTTPTSSAAACSTGSFTSGWIIFQDDDKDGAHGATEPVILNHQAVDPTLRINNLRGDRSLGGYNGTGQPTVGTSGIVAVTGLTICDSRGNQANGINSTARAIYTNANTLSVISNGTGRVRIGKLRTDVTSAGGCP